MTGDKPEKEEVDIDLLNFLGVSVEAEETQTSIKKERRFILWKENEQAFFLFCDVAFVHKQWVSRGMGGELFSLDGNYLLSYLYLNFKKKEVRKLLPDIQLIASSYLKESHANKKDK